MLTPNAEEMNEHDWAYPDGRFLAYVLGPTDPGFAALFIVLNAAAQPIGFTLPKLTEYQVWRQLLDTTDERAVIAPFASGASSTAPPRSVLVFAGSVA